MCSPTYMEAADQMADEKEQPQVEAADGPKPKKPYSTPRITDYGTVASLTLGSGEMMGDAVSGKKVT